MPATNRTEISPGVVPTPMDARTIATYDRPVPRYTSYPSAAQFDQRIGSVQHAAWLGELADRVATLYLHVPFCAKLCWYCACHTAAVNRPESLETYADGLNAELERVGQLAPRVVIGAIQWGGGTPSQLGPRRLAAVARRIATTFDRRSGAEMSMEADPRYCDDELVATMKAMGVGRVSIGVQDFEPAVQRAINRLQTVEETSDAVGRCRRAGIRSVNIDLVYGLPHQTLDSLASTLESALEIQPDRFAVFAYAHVPWMKARQNLIPAETLPGAALRADMAALVTQRLRDAGYVEVGLDHFALPSDALAQAAAAGRLRRTFQGYVTDDSPWVLGIGASAISSLPSGYVQNDSSTERYLRAVQSGMLATARGIQLTKDDRLRAAIIGRLMCGYGVDLRGLCVDHRVDFDAFVADIPGLVPLLEDGLAVLAGGQLSLTARGRPLVRTVCAAFDRYYTGAPGRHARGI